MNRLKQVLLVCVGSVLAWMLFASSFAVMADEHGVGGTIPPLQPLQKTVHSETGRIGKAYSGEVVTYTLSFHNTTEMSYTARIGLTDTVPLSLTVIDRSIQTADGEAGLLSGNRIITWVVDVEYDRSYTLTYAAHTPFVSTATSISNVVELYEIENTWVPTPTQATTSTIVVLLVEPSPALYLPVATKAKEELKQLVNLDFEKGAGSGWRESPGTLIFKRENLYPSSPDGVHVAWLGGAYSEINELAQQITLPTEYDSLGVTYLYMVDSGESNPNEDKAEVRITAAGVQMQTVSHELTRSNSKGWQRGVIDLSGFKGKLTTFTFWASLNSTVNSNFFVDKVEICSNDEIKNPATVRRCDNLAIP
jgi:uncharacterized repeat protein (TIGR01451 family)